MTREEAIERIQVHLAYMGQYEAPKTKKALCMAIAALREQASNESQRVFNTSNALGGWVSVAERLPECDQRVLCRYTFGDDGRMYFYQVLDYYATDPQPHFQHTLGDSKMRVTHWMPLPEPPKEV